MSMPKIMSFQKSQQTPHKQQPFYLYYLISIIIILYQLQQLLICDQVKWKDHTAMTWQEMQFFVGKKEKKNSPQEGFEAVQSVDKIPVTWLQQTGSNHSTSAMHNFGLTWLLN